MIKRIFYLALFFALYGCVAGQHIKMDYVPEGAADNKRYSSVLLSVSDVREYVLSGEKDKSYIGRYRAGFGNPWSVTTYQRVSLEAKFLEDLKKEMESLGFNNNSPAPDRKKLLVDIIDWNFDGFQNGRFWYEIVVKVEDASGKIVASDTLKEEIIVKGTVMMGARGGFEREVPIIYGKVLKAMVRNNQKIFAALTN